MNLQITSTQIFLIICGFFKKLTLNTSFYFFIVFLLVFLLKTENSYAQEEYFKGVNNKLSDSAAIAKKHQEDSLRATKKLDANETDWGWSTARVGIAYIHDFAYYTQDATGKAQMDSADVELKNDLKPRDFRVFASGVLRTKRYVQWRAAIMWDGSNDIWTFRETGFLVGFPEVKSRMFIGRSKEGYSMNKVQNGYSCWMNERQMSLDLIPIMTDGVRWYGYLPKQGFLWSVGAFTNIIYLNEAMMPWEWQFTTRLGWMPIRKDTDKKLLYLAGSVRYTKPADGSIRVKSRPESNPAPYFIDTKFECDRSTGFGGEFYYRSGPLMLGSEFNGYYFNSTQAGNPLFWGGNAVVTYIFTGETRPWIKENAVFHFVEPKKSLFKGGPGAWELCLNFSYFNTNDGYLPGGTFWRFTPMINWYVSKNFRIEFVYGYGVLDRFNLKGATQFYQARFQFQLI